MNRNPLDQSLKEKYFAAHWGQDVMRSTHNKYCGEVNPLFAFADWVWLELRPISATTDSEAIEVAKIIDPGFESRNHRLSAKEFVLEYMEFVMDTMNAWASVIDYLRSIGIALPFMGYSVNELKQAGWVKTE